MARTAEVRGCRRGGQHAVLVAHDLGEMPMGEVAAMLWIRQATAWNRLRLGRAAVRETLRRSAKEPL